MGHVKNSSAAHAHAPDDLQALNSLLIPAAPQLAGHEEAVAALQRAVLASQCIGVLLNALQAAEATCKENNGAFPRHALMQSSCSHLSPLALCSTMHVVSRATSLLRLRTELLVHPEDFCIVVTEC